MNTTSKCLKEGNPIVEALGSGLQSIVIRNYKPAPFGKQFLLFPTSVYRTYNMENSFKENYEYLTIETIEPFKINNKTEIKYYATVEYVMENNKVPIECYDDFHIWNKDYVKNSLNYGKVYIWLLRVYKIKGKHFVSHSGGNTYGNIKENVSLDSLKPVISDDKFKKIKEKLISIEFNYLDDSKKIIDDDINQDNKKLFNEKLDKILENQDKILNELNNVKQSSNVSSHVQNIKSIKMKRMNKRK